MKARGVFCAMLLAAAAWGAADRALSVPQASNIKVVPFERLQALLPDLSGWTRGEPQGETDLEEAVSRVQVDYEKGESTLSFEIMDWTMNNVMLNEVRPLVKAGHLEKRANGYTKATTVRGFPATEEWTNEVRSGYVSVLINDRFVVKVTGEYVPDVDIIRKAVEAVDLQKLAALK